MNASKTLTALAAAAALVGTIGYASAQQGSDTMAPNAGSPADPSTQQSPPATSPADTTSAPATVDSTSSQPMDTTSNTMDSERAPQADRN